MKHATAPKSCSAVSHASVKVHDKLVFMLYSSFLFAGHDKANAELPGFASCSDFLVLLV